MKNKKRMRGEIFVDGFSIPIFEREKITLHELIGETSRHILEQRKPLTVYWGDSHYQFNITKVRKMS